jgi:PEP-CTERM motif
VAACATNSSAASIPGLQDTGVGTPSNPDPVWQITLDPSGGSVPRAATIVSPLTGTSPFNWYAGAPIGAGANWIGPNSTANINPGVPDGTYEYELQFNLTGYNPATASFVYESAADNFVTNATLNGVGISYDTRVPGGGNQYHTLSGPISVTGPFVSGINTLVFDVSNTTPNPSPTGFLFLVDSSSVTAVPEPSSIALVGIGLLGAVGMILRRKA